MGKYTNGESIKDVLRTHSLRRLAEISAEIRLTPLQPGEEPGFKADLLRLIDEVYEEEFERQNLAAAAPHARTFIERLLREPAEGQPRSGLGNTREGWKATHARPAKARGAWYNARAIAGPLHGIVTSETIRANCYAGSAADLIAAGIASAGMFPGQPGRPTTSVTYRPLGVERAGTSWSFVPGFMHIIRRSRSTFRIEVTVSAEERQRRFAHAELEQDEYYRRIDQRIDEFKAQASAHGEAERSPRLHLVWPVSAAPRAGGQS